MGEHSVIIAAKMHPPRLRQTAVARDALMADFSPFISRRLTLVSAPTGYGKTTSVGLWLETINRPYAWLSLDEHDSHVYNFVRYLVTAIQSVQPAAQMSITACLESVPMAEPHQLADCLLRDFAELKSPLVIVLDDYHTIEDLYIHTFMRRLVTHLPPHVHMVIITRADPPFPLARLRVQGDVIDIRSNDLRFSTSEAAQLLEFSTGLALPSHLIDRIRQVTEGWPAGIQLAAISLQQTRNPEELANRLSQQLDHLYIEYLLDELFRELDPQTQLLLARMAIFARVSAPLIELVRAKNFAGPTSEEIIAKLWRSNYFLTSLDQDGIWYQLHDLIRSFLLQELARHQSDETVCALHLQASSWFFQHGFQKEAFEHAFRSGDKSHIIRCAEQAATAAINADDWRYLEVLLRTLPASVTERPLLLVAKAYLHNYQNNYNSVPVLLDAATVGLTTNACGLSADELLSLDGQIQALRAVTAAGDGMYEDAVHHAERAEKSLPSTMVSARGYAGLARNFAMVRRSSGDEISKYVRADLQQLDRYKEPHVVRQLMGFSFAFYEDANIWSMRELILQLKPVIQQSGQPIFLGRVDFWLGWIHYQRNALAAAQACFSRVIAARDSVQTREYVEAATGMALALYRMGKAHESKQCIIDLHEFVLQRGMVDLGLVAESLAVRLSLDIDADGHIPFALPPMHQMSVKRTNITLWEWPPATFIRSCLRRGSASALMEAEAYLRKCEEWVRQARSTSRAIELAVLRAQLSHRRGDGQAAQDALRMAVDLAAPGGTLRLIADDADGLDPYWAALRDAGHLPMFMDELYPVVAADAELQSKTNAETVKRRRADNYVPALENALTFREAEVLSYLQQGQSNKEIARRLSISASTVRKHTINIYDKLQVANRTQAAAKARQLDLGLPQLQPG